MGKLGQVWTQVQFFEEPPSCLLSCKSADSTYVFCILHFCTIILFLSFSVMFILTRIKWHFIVIFDLHFSYSQCYSIFFPQVFIVHFYFYFWEMSVQAFCSYPNCIAFCCWVFEFFVYSQCRSFARWILCKYIFLFCRLYVVLVITSFAVQCLPLGLL